MRKPIRKNFQQKEAQLILDRMVISNIGWIIRKSFRDRDVRMSVLLSELSADKYLRRYVPLVKKLKKTANRAR